MIASAQTHKKLSPLKWYLELLDVLVRRNLKRRYRGSFLGVYWSLLNPLVMTAVYGAIFGKNFIEQGYYDSIGEYSLAAFTGLLVINFFSSSTAQALPSVVDNGAIVNKIRLPLSIFPLSTMGANIFQLLTGTLPLLLIVTLFLSRNFINTFALFFPLLSLILVSTGVGLLMSSLYVFFRDLSYFYELVTFFLLFSSPIFYPLDIIPQEVQSFLILNPLLPIIESIRQIALSGNLPDSSLIFHALISGLIVLTIGIAIFRSWQTQFMDLL